MTTPRETQEKIIETQEMFQFRYINNFRRKSIDAMLNDFKTV